jgi:hypothetical protein
MKDMLSISDINRVTGIMAALIAGDAVKVLGEDVDDLAFSLIAPLKADDGEVRLHLNVYPQGSSISSRSWGTKGNMRH